LHCCAVIVTWDICIWHCIKQKTPVQKFEKLPNLDSSNNNNNIISNPSTFTRRTVWDSIPRNTAEKGGLIDLIALPTYLEWKAFFDRLPKDAAGKTMYDIISTDPIGNEASDRDQSHEKGK
jgi:hypothetical protein